MPDATSAPPKEPAPIGQSVEAIHHLGAAHNAIREWRSANNHSLAEPDWEIYGHWQPEWNTNPSQIRANIIYQLAV